MKLKIESDNLEEFRKEIPPYIEYSTPLIQEKIHHINSIATNDKERAKIAFELVRDNISHSFDTKSKVITIGANDTLKKQEGICFAKSHLLATLLRGMGIPTGFCYQKVLRQGTIESGYALHGLNAVYIEGIGWFRLDPRGNKQGIDSQFAIDKEKLAYPIRKELGEIDYNYVFIAPLPSVITAMEQSEDCQALFYNRPEEISVEYTI
ncbi:MAG TPA: transglutaminase family protein [Candidatus Kapabacteria bacterium]|nr:transglutaminase family protein [Candidatus Kapabacteria bacterium]